MTSLPSKKTTETKGEKAAYEAFNAVDKLVSKPVMGSDGASRWQNFRADNKQIYELARPSVAPVAPLKVSDRKAGFGSWNEERQNEVKVRTTAGDAALNAGYTNFQHKNSETAEEVARKKHEKQVRKRVRPEEEPYYIKPADDGVTFQGHKFDYIFTTKDKKTGYYWDGMDSVKKLDQGDSPADTSIHMKKQEKTSSSSAPTETNSATEQPKKKKRKKVKQAVIIDDPNNPMEQVAAAIQRRQLAATGATGGGGGDVAWETALDPTSGKTYYFCRATGERKWEKPEPETLPLPQGWQSAKDPNTGKEYFYHAATAETRWERPPNANR